MTVFCIPVLIREDLLAVLALVDGLVAVLAFLLEVFSQRVKNGACAGAGILLVPPQLKRGGEQLITVFTAVHLLVCMHNKTETVALVGPCLCFSPVQHIKKQNL